MIVKENGKAVNVKIESPRDGGPCLRESHYLLKGNLITLVINRKLLKGGSIMHRINLHKKEEG